MGYFSSIENDIIIYLKLKLMTKEEVVKMLMYFAKWESEMFYKYMDDEDGGKGAFTEFVEDYLKLGKEHE